MSPGGEDKGSQSTQQGNRFGYYLVCPASSQKFFKVACISGLNTRRNRRLAPDEGVDFFLDLRYVYVNVK